MSRTGRATVGLAALLLAVIGGSGVAYAADGPSGGPTPAPVSQAQPVAQKGVSLSGLGLTRVQVRAVGKAVRDGMEAARDAKLDAALDKLVVDGVMTKDQADEVALAVPGGLRDLVKAGTVTRDQLDQLKVLLDAAGPVDRHTVAQKALTTLADAGTITSEQAAAILERIDAMPMPGPKGPGVGGNQQGPGMGGNQQGPGMGGNQQGPGMGGRPGR